eukprot:m.118907 g.118907  ORF g.118907 m.118907 type:complete len:518 (-) comp9347_c1_seq1:1372-2925(-)
MESTMESSILKETHVEAFAQGENEIDNDAATSQLMTDLIYSAMCSEPKKESAFFQNILSQCQTLMERDYTIEVVENKGLVCACPTYPTRLFFITGEKGKPKAVNDCVDMKKLVENAQYARCRKRFPFPVIFFNNKHVCRSATLSIPQEVYGRPYLDGISMVCKYLLGDGDNTQTAPNSNGQKGGDLAENVKGANDTIDADDASNSVPSRSSTGCSTNNRENRGNGDENDEDFMKDVEIVDLDDTDMKSLQTVEDCDTVMRYRIGDIRLLQALGVKVVFDLMVENKKFKYLFYVSSSEKVLGDMYKPFELAVMPYPGVELFYNADIDEFDCSNLKHDWSTPEFDAIGSVAHVPALDIDFSNYKEWSLQEITNSYLKLLVHFAASNTSDGILIHCISGWDRTPLFTSLLRITLWADGLIHQSLNAKEMLLLSIGYDWVLFGHQLHTRMKKKENIFHFNFNYLQHITGPEFACALAEDKALRHDRLLELRKLFLEVYLPAKQKYDEKKLNSNGWLGWLLG